MQKANKMMKIKDKATEWAYNLQIQMQSQAQAEFVQKVMSWEDCSWEEAIAICTRKTDPVEPEYSLGYKMCDPLGMLARNTQLRKKDRMKAQEDFMKLLEPDELEIYKSQVLNEKTRQQFNDELKKEQKKHEKGKN